MNLEDFRSLPPFTADALIDHANGILAPRSPMTRRTLRFYISQSVVPPPLGSPKFARYNYRHLLHLLSARALQDQGKTLTFIARQMNELSEVQIEEIVKAWLFREKMVVRETRAEYRPDEVHLGLSSTRITLTDKASLELQNSESTKKELARAYDELGKLIKKLEK